MLIDLLPFKTAFALSVGLCVLCVGLLFIQLLTILPSEDRTYMDPLPGPLKLLWPLIRIIAEFGCSLLPYEMMERTEKRLQRTGVGYLLSAEQFWALRIVVTFIFLLIGWWAMTMAPDLNPRLTFFVAFVLGVLLPSVWLSDARKRREHGVKRALPQYLDFITMAVEAGLNLQGAIANAVEKSQPGPLRNELNIVMRDIRSGLTRGEALRRMSDRLDISEVTSLVNSLIQAERMGASLGQVLRVQSDQRRNERFQRAEKMAMEAPVKLIFPLIMFIFPLTFLILGFPIVMRFLGEGLI